jgi:hypothetical protein
MFQPVAIQGPPRGGGGLAHCHLAVQLLVAERPDLGHANPGVGAQVPYDGSLQLSIACEGLGGWLGGSLRQRANVLPEPGTGADAKAGAAPAGSSPAARGSGRAAGLGWRAASMEVGLTGLERVGVDSATLPAAVAAAAAALRAAAVAARWAAKGGRGVVASLSIGRLHHHLSPGLPAAPRSARQGRPAEEAGGGRRRTTEAGRRRAGARKRGQGEGGGGGSRLQGNQPQP